jgi:hypothetical protein
LNSIFFKQQKSQKLWSTLEFSGSKLNIESSQKLKKIRFDKKYV